jgi:hypothetical protein
MKTYQVKKIGGSYLVLGLADESYDSADPVCSKAGKDTLLLYIGEGTEGDQVIDAPHTRRKMHSALYDLYQTNDNLREGDEFETPFGKFKCEGVHVVEGN